MEMIEVIIDEYEWYPFYILKNDKKEIARLKEKYPELLITRKMPKVIYDEYILVVERLRDLSKEIKRYASNT